MANFDFGPDEIELLAEACRTMDRIDQLERDLAGQPSTMAGSRGQPITNPLIQEIRWQASLLGKLLGQLNLPPPGEKGQIGVLSPKSVRARRAARARWSKHAST